MKKKQDAAMISFPILHRVSGGLGFWIDLDLHSNMKHFFCGFEGDDQVGRLGGGTHQKSPRQCSIESPIRFCKCHGPHCNSMLGSKNSVHHEVRVVECDEDCGGVHCQSSKKFLGVRRHFSQLHHMYPTVEIIRKHRKICKQLQNNPDAKIDDVFTLTLDSVTGIFRYPRWNYTFLGFSYDGMEIGDEYHLVVGGQHCPMRITNRFFQIPLNDRDPFYCVLAQFHQFGIFINKRPAQIAFYIVEMKLNDFIYSLPSNYVYRRFVWHKPTLAVYTGGLYGIIILLGDDTDHLVNSYPLVVAVRRIEKRYWTKIMNRIMRRRATELRQILTSRLLIRAPRCIQQMIIQYI